jgi:hypothetical protein
MNINEQVVVKDIFGYLFSNKKGIITEIGTNDDRAYYRVLLDLGVELYFDEDEIEPLSDIRNRKISNLI